MPKTRLIALMSLALVAGCEPSPLTPQELETAKSLALMSLEPIPPSPSNAQADNPQAAALGAKIFFDAGFSGNGAVACATCHLPDRQLQDDLPLAKGVGTTDRRSMPLLGAAWSPFLFWDGRKDSLWSQALGPLESPVEHGATRTFHARHIAGQYKAEYEAIFGTFPDAKDWPAHAGPGGTKEEQTAWQVLPENTRKEIDQVFANIGKSLEAFQRTLPLLQTRFDIFIEALAKGQNPEPDQSLNTQEIAGFQLFTGKGECINCHNGPRLTDDHFHNTGVGEVAGLPKDRGRAAAIALLDSDPFNCLGAYSDAAPGQCGELQFMSRDEHEFERAFKPPSLRGAAARPPYMHSGQISSIEAVVEHYSLAPEAPSGHTELKPLNLTTEEKAALIAFLHTLDPL